MAISGNEGVSRPTSVCYSQSVLCLCLTVPSTQLGFILNLQQHWFTLRRFGPAEAKIDLDTGEGHWFNLNSFLPAPEWVGKLYLGMLLQQAEADGIST